jgi:hypothetical protein
VFDYADASGLKAQKVFSIAPAQPYVIHVTASLTRGGQPLPLTLRWGPGPGQRPHHQGRRPELQPAAAGALLQGRQGQPRRPREDSEQPVQEGTFGFAGVDDHYFLTAVVKPEIAVRAQYAAVDVAIQEHPEGAHYTDWSVRYPAKVAAKVLRGPERLRRARRGGS